MNAQLISLQTQLATYWAARNAQERLAITVVAGLLALIVYGSIAYSLHQGINSLQRRLPELQLESYEIAAGGKGAAPRAPHGGDLRSDLFKVLADRDLHADLRALSPSQVEVRLPDQDAKSVFGDLNTIRQASDAHVISLQIRTADKGNTGIVATLERAP
jgi:type II secretory pathway component PulM